MLMDMATAQTVIDFVERECTVTHEGHSPIGPFRRQLQQWARNQGLNAPTGRLITRVLRERYNVRVEGRRYDWDYVGLIRNNPED